MTCCAHTTLICEDCGGNASYFRTRVRELEGVIRSAVDCSNDANRLSWRVQELESSLAQAREEAGRYKAALAEIAPGPSPPNSLLTAENAFYVARAALARLVESDEGGK